MLAARYVRPHRRSNIREWFRASPYLFRSPLRTLLIGASAGRPRSLLMLPSLASERTLTNSGYSLRRVAAVESLRSLLKRPVLRSTMFFEGHVCSISSTLFISVTIVTGRAELVDPRLRSSFRSDVVPRQFQRTAKEADSSGVRGGSVRRRLPDGSAKHSRD